MKIDEQYLIDQYKKLHQSNFYGDSSEDYLDMISPIVQVLQPKSILDYGCGRSSLVNHFYNWGETKLYKYDPAIPDYETLEIRKYDLILCTDVMEHILEEDINGIIKRFKTLTDKVLFVITVKPSRATLPDGRNAHVTVMDYPKWRKHISTHFKNTNLYKPIYWDNDGKQEIASVVIKTWR